MWRDLLFADDVGYRAARNALLAGELGLRRQMEAVAAPLNFGLCHPGGEVPRGPGPILRVCGISIARATKVSCRKMLRYIGPFQGCDQRLQGGRITAAMRILRYDIVARLIGRIYEAVLDPAHWVDFLNDLHYVFDGHALNLSLLDPSDGTLVYGAHAKCDETFVDDYRKYYSSIDPWVAEARRRNLLRPGLIALGEPIVPPNALKMTEFYNDFGRYYDSYGGVSGLFEVGQSLMALSIVQHKFGQFGLSEVGLVEALVPHLERAMQIHLRLEGVGITSAWATAAFDRLNGGVLFVSASGKLLFANKAARDILQRREGISTLRGELHAATPSETARLREAIATAIRVRDGEVRAASTTVVIQRSVDRRPLSILIAPLPRGTRLAVCETAAVAMFVTDPERSVTTEVETIRVILGLTPSEAQLAKLLAAGKSIKEAADLLTIRLETARKRLKVIFHKTDTHRQSDLVRLVLRCTMFDPSAG
jgi:DNA-binding CsgD family transcriptional regulator/PAS domain-containing protein